jgi:hypothetical protein
MNIVEILKDAPKGTQLYSSAYGNVIFRCIESDIIMVRDANNITRYFSQDGRIPNLPDCECTLFPSKENRDWNAFKVETLCNFKPFDPVLVRDMTSDDWRCNYFSHIDGENYICMGSSWNYCIPYNDETKHLIGTNKSFM